MTEQQKQAYQNHLEGYLRMGYPQRVAEFLARVSAGVISGDIIEGDTPPRSASSTGARR